MTLMTVKRFWEVLLFRECRIFILWWLYVFQAGLIKRFVPLFDRILVERFAPEIKTKGGVLLPEKSQGKVLEATVLAVGPGARNEVYSCSAGMLWWVLTRSAPTPGCLQQLEIYWNLKTLLEILEISLNLMSSWRFLCKTIDRIGFWS